jgi:hypothetical protein
VVEPGTNWLYESNAGFWAKRLSIIRPQLRDDRCD